MSKPEQRIWVQLRRRDMDGLGEAFVLAHVELDYHAEVRGDHGQVEVVARLAELGRSSFRIEHEIRLPDGALAASGLSVMVAWDRANRVKRALSDAERAALSAAGEPGDRISHHGTARP